MKNGGEIVGGRSEEEEVMSAENVSYARNLIMPFQTSGMIICY